MIKQMGKENLYILMEAYIMANGKRIKQKVMEFFKVKTDQNIEASGRMITKMGTEK